MPTHLVINSYMPVYPEGGTWDDTIAHLLDIDKPVLDGLTQDLVRHGRFREPVNLSGVPGEWYDGEPPSVMNGTHRVCTAILTGAPSLLVRYGYDEPVGNQSLVTKMTIVDQQLAADEVFNEVFQDVIFDHIRSFRLTDEVWATSSGGGGRIGHWESYWECDVDATALAHVSQLNERVLRILSEQTGYSPQTFAVSTTVEHYND